jgi:diguanylate cyclase (GGDEF)-like protein
MPLYLLPVAIAAAAALAALLLAGHFSFALLAMGVVVAVVLALLLALILHRLDTAPVAAARQFVTQLESGLQPAALETTRTDDLGELLRALNRLTNRDKAVQQANTDALTGLANRRGMVQKLEQAFKAGKELALFYVDLDKFKPVNDQYGHEMGDAVLRKVAEFLNACAREGDLVGRLGGDEFVIVFYGLTDRKLLTERAEKLLALLNEPFWINGTRIKIGGSIGITIAPADGSSTEALLNAADETMYAVKKAGRNNFKFYS